MPSRPSILMIGHGLGGGVERHIVDLARILEKRANVLIMEPAKGGLLRVRHKLGEYPSCLFFDPQNEIPQLTGFLQAVAIQSIHFHHTVRLPWGLCLLPRDLGIPYDYTAHDYFSFCPQITLTSEHFRYCGEPDQAGCRRCLSVRPTALREDIAEWRSRYRGFVEGAARVFVPTQGVGERLARHFPEARIVLAPHPDPSEAEHDTTPISVERGELRVAVLGTLNPPKGADLLESCAQDAAERKLPIRFHLVGEAYRSLEQGPHSALRVHGRYTDAELGERLASVAPHLVWFPAQWPETYSFTLSAAMRFGYPIAATDIGAFHDRLAGKPECWLLPWDTKAQEWNELFIRLAAKGEDRQSEAQKVRAVDKGSFSYETDYLPLDAGNAPVAAAGFNPERFVRSWRARPGFLISALKEDSQIRLRGAYRIPGVRRIATALMPEHRYQRLRRWLDRF
jgi:glycosyltransferase involved in cell wall biosynthesis